jgi:hypothetical protein
MTTNSLRVEQLRSASTVDIAPAPFRNPLGIPAGSVRALLILMVLAMVWVLMLMPPEKNVHVPLYLYYLLFLTVGAYFSSRAKTSPQNGDAQPLHLPRRSIRLLIIAGCVGVVAYAIHQNPNFLDTTLLQPDEKPTLVLPLVLLGSFFVGIASSAFGERVLAGPAGLPAWWQDLQAWLSLLAVLGLGVQVLLELVIFPSMDPAQRPNLPHLQLLLSGIIAFYFGARV